MECWGCQAAVGRTVLSELGDSEGMVVLALVGCVTAAYERTFENSIC